MQIDREKFRLLLGRLDRSQAWVAKKAGLSRQALQHYLVGRPIPTHTYVRLAAALGTTDFTITPAVEPAAEARAA